jgi:hypothetical protein
MAINTESHAILSKKTDEFTARVDPTAWVFFRSRRKEVSGMATQTTFTTEEWTLLRIVPSLVVGGVSAADPSGIFGAIKEAAAGMTEMIESLQKGSKLELLGAMLADRSIPGMPDPKTLVGEGDREQQMANLKSAVLGRIQEVANLVSRKATPEEAKAYKQMIMSVAEKAANASKEGGFLGFGGVRVSSAEESFLNEVKAVLQLT